MNNPNPAEKAPSSACSQGSVTANVSGGGVTKTVSHKYTAKRTPRSIPGSTTATNFSRLPPDRHMLYNTSSTPATPTAPNETAASSKLPHFISRASRARTHHAGTRPDLPIRTQVSLNSSQGRQTWRPDVFQSSFQDTSQPAGQVSMISTRRRHVLDSQPLSKVGLPNDNLYEFTFSAPIMEQPKPISRMPTETVPFKTSCSPMSSIPKSQPLPTSSSRKGHNSYPGHIYIDLTQDCSSPTSEPSATANETNILHSQKAEPGEVATAKLLDTNDKVNPQSPFISDASSDLLPSTDNICATVARGIPRTPGQKRKRDSRSPDGRNGVRKDAVSSSASTTIPSVTQQVVQDTIQSPSQTPHQKKITTSTETAVQRKVKSLQFDSSAFDTALYQQPDAAPPPAGVVIGPHIEKESLNEGRGRYIYANPAIHGMHNRSEAWHERKALEIQSRGGRKFLFGKVSARRRWWKRQRIGFSKAQDVTGNQMPERSDPEPRTYKRPLDFGDVPESELPEKVRENPDWLKACEWFRQQKNLQSIRLRESKRCEQEANEYYKIISQGGIPDLGTQDYD